ncbi:MAG: hypothetical protein V1792_12780 [Pseudomonadota bacterium]
MAQTATGVDSFVKYWISLETLAMKDTTKVRPINEILAKCYDLTVKAATNRFHVGRLYGVRGDIVHKGVSKGIDLTLKKYLEAIYLDVLFHKLGLPCEHRAGSLLESVGSDVFRSERRSDSLGM